MEFHVAPMKNVSNWKFRQSIQGATDSYTEMIQLRDILAHKPRVRPKLEAFPIKGQRQWVQILTNSLRDIAKLPAILHRISSQYPDRSDFFGININAGCPDPQIIAAGQGAALIKRRKRITDLVQTFLMSGTHDYHINLKFRLGMNPRDVDMKILIDVLAQLAAIDDPRLHVPIIHFKHAKQQSDELPIWSYLPHLFDAEQAFILNGNLTGPQDLTNIRSQFDPSQQWFGKCVKGIMIGRALIPNPQLFLSFQKENV